MMNYVIFHDESQEEGYWHGLLFVPEERVRELATYLDTIRTHAKWGDDKLNIKGLNSKAKKYRAIWASMDLFQSLSRVRRTSGESDSVRQPVFKEGLGTYYEEIISISEMHGLKFVLLNEKDGHQNMSHHQDYGSKIETTFRFALKGGAHFMFDETNPIQIRQIHFDGYEHMGRPVDKERIIRNLHDEFRPYSTIHPEFEVDDRQINDRKGDATFLIMNFVDNLVGAWHGLATGTVNSYKQGVATPLHPIFERWQSKEIILNKRSRWRKSVSLSECWLENDKWQFKSIAQITTEEQPDLFA